MGASVSDPIYVFAHLVSLVQLASIVGHVYMAVHDLSALSVYFKQPQNIAIHHARMEEHAIELEEETTVFVLLDTLVIHATQVLYLFQ